MSDPALFSIYLISDDSKRHNGSVDYWAGRYPPFRSLHRILSVIDLYSLADKSKRNRRRYLRNDVKCPKVLHLLSLWIFRIGNSFHRFEYLCRIPQNFYFISINHCNSFPLPECHLRNDSRM